MKALSILMVSCLAVCTAASSEIEKHSILGPRGIELFWWPKLSVPTGWVHDEQQSLDMQSNVLRPQGKTFRNAPVVIYARAFYVADKKSRGTLQSLIEGDIKGIRRGRSGIVVTELATTPTPTRKLRTFSFTKQRNNFERVCYGQEDDYWIVFVISAKTRQALEHDLHLFTAMMAGYR